MTKAEREAYNRRLKIRRDNYAADEFAREKAAMEREKAIAGAKEEALREVAAKMLAMGLSPEQISQATGLTDEEIKGLN